MFEAPQPISECLLLWLEQETLPAGEQKTLWEYYAGYRRHFPVRLQHYYRRQIAEVMALLRHHVGAHVLEIGCDTGTESLWMAMHGASVDAVELSQERFRTAMSRKAVLEHDLGRRLDCTFINTTLLDMEVSAHYDILWMEQAFHHLELREAVVDRLVSLVRPGGHIVISESNALNHPLLQTQLFRQRGFATIRHFEDHTGRRHPYGDERILTAHSLARLFMRRGVARVSVEYFRVFPNHSAFDSLLALEQSTPAWLSPLFPHFNYVGRKAAPGPQRGTA